MIEKVVGLKVIIRVDGFHDAKDWIYRMVRAGVARCAECDNPATSVFWQDQAEWYCLCGEHWEGGDQWTGSTRWNPESFSKIVVPGKAQEWVNALSPDERKKVRLVEFDATDYDALLPDDYMDNYEVVVLYGTKENGTHIRIYQLTDGRYCYEKIQSSPSFGYHHGRKAPFDSREACIQDAQS